MFNPGRLRGRDWATHDGANITNRSAYGRKSDLFGNSYRGGGNRGKYFGTNERTHPGCSATGAQICTTYRSVVRVSMGKVCTGRSKRLLARNRRATASCG